MQTHIEEDRGYVTPCWIWQGATNSEGYARCSEGYVHRINYEREVAPIPKGLTLDHLCRVRHCVRPAHLEPVTRGENCRRGARAKLTQTKADDIRRRVHRGEATADVALRYGVAACTVSNIVAGRNWA